MPNSDDIILHNYHLFASPFSERVRLVLGLKNLSWYSVECPIAPPRPKLDPIAGGYRRIPVMQIGADAYCDSRCIIDELERRYPHPTIYPNSERGLTEALTCWANGAMLMNVFGLYFGAETDHVDPKYLRDRVESTGGLVDIAQMQSAVPYFLDQIRVHISWVDRQLGAGTTTFLLGSRAGAADFTAYQHIWWLVQTYSRADQLLRPFRNVAAWMDRIAAIGNGHRIDLSEETALEVAIRSEPGTRALEDAEDPSGRKVGDRVQVMPDDYMKVPVIGELLALDVDRIAIRRVDPVAGNMVVHFPRSGFIVVPA
jgi:glutathione S-transferase